MMLSVEGLYTIQGGLPIIVGQRALAYQSVGA